MGRVSYAQTEGKTQRRITKGEAVMFRSRFASAAVLILLQGCALIVEGTDQTISLESNPSGATCRFYREGMVIANVVTPGGVVVEKTKHDLTVECQKDGYQTAKANLDSEVEDWAWGNILLGGVIGWGIDSASGADNHYPEYLNVTLVPAVDAPETTTLKSPEEPLIWHTINDDVLAYSEFGGNGDSLEMPSALDLVMKRQIGGWGIFDYKALGGQRGQAWIFMGDVRPSP
jgi:hypothetical protein